MAPEFGVNLYTLVLSNEPGIRYVSGILICIPSFATINNTFPCRIAGVISTVVLATPGLPLRLREGKHSTTGVNEGANDAVRTEKLGRGGGR